MPPKVKISKEAILHAAMDYIRKNGETALNARALAQFIGCSTQPIFSNYSSMEELRQEAIQSANHLYQQYLEEEMTSSRYPTYKASGMAYIRFAKEEKELFKLLFMRDRSDEQIDRSWKGAEDIIALSAKTTGLSMEKAKLFHMEMWIYVHGIATMLATGYLPLEWEDISNMITDAYEGMKKRYLV